MKPLRMPARQQVRAFFVDLKRRRVYRSFAVYVAAGFVVIEGADLLLPVLSPTNPDFIYRVVVVVVLLGLPVAMFLSWAYDLTPGGLVADPGPASARYPAPSFAGLRTQGAEEKRDSSVVVLPFDDLSPAADAGYLCHSLADEIITDLASVGVSVISRTTATQLGDIGTDVRTLRAELGVRYLLEGAVRNADGIVRINLKLVDCASSSVVWANKFTGELADLFEFPEDIARQVAESLPVELAPERIGLLSKRRVSEPKAFEYYLRARHEILHFSESAVRRAESYLERALEIMEDNVTLLGAMGYVQWQYFNAGVDGSPDRLDRAAACARRIQEIEPESARAHQLLGLVAHQRGEAAAAVAELKAAVELDPNDTDALLWLSILFSIGGQTERAAALVDRILWIDPLPALHQGLRGFLGVMKGDFAKGVEGYRRALDLELGNPILALGYGQALAMAGRIGDASSVLGRLGEAGEGLLGVLASFLKRALKGDGLRALELLTDEVRAVVSQDAQLAWTVAQGLALIGEDAQAMEYLSHARDHGMVNRLLLAERDPLLDSLRGTADFEAFLASIPDEPGRAGPRPYADESSGIATEPRK